MGTLSQAAFGLAFLLASQVLPAGTFSVAPIRLTLTAQQPTGMLTVRNNGDAETIVQLQANTWMQQDGADVLEPSAGLIAVPPLFMLSPGASQVVRVGLRHPPAPSRELTYRLLLREVPPPIEEDFNGLQVTLNLSLPVFVLPPREARPELFWRFSRAEDGHAVLNAHNRGNAHARVRAVVLAGPDGATIEGANLPVYLLPDQSCSWPLANGIRSGRWVLKAETDAGPVEMELVLEPN